MKARHLKHGKGTLSKLQVMSYFVDNGYYIYNEMSNTGPVDFVAIHPVLDIVRLIEVKTWGKRQDGSRINRVLSEDQKSMGVELVYYDIESDKVTEVYHANKPTASQGRSNGTREDTFCY